MNTENFGTVEFKGKAITLEQDPYLDGPRPRYVASGVDQDGSEVQVIWAVKDCYMNEDGHIIESEYIEEADLCDWDNPVDVYVY